MSSLETCSFINPITRPVKSLRHPPPFGRKVTSPAWNLTIKSIPKPLQTSFRRFSTINTNDPQATWNITVPYDNVIGIERDGQYSQTLYHGNHVLVPNRDRIVFDYYLFPYYPIRVSTANFEGTDGEKNSLGMKTMIIAKIEDPRLAYEKCGNSLENWDKNQEPINMEKNVEIQKALEKVISKMLSDKNIPQFFRKRIYRKKSYEFIFEEEIRKFGVFDEINKVITPLYGLKCERFRYRDGISWFMSPGLAGRLFGVAGELAWRKFIGLHGDEARDFEEWSGSESEDYEELSGSESDFEEWSGSESDE